MHVDRVRVDAEGPFGDEQVRDEDAGALGLVGQIEQLGQGIESVERVLGSHDEALEIALARPQHLPEVALLGLGRHAGRGTGAHHVDKDGGHLEHAGHPQRLGHQREATT